MLIIWGQTDFETIGSVIVFKMASTDGFIIGIGMDIWRLLSLSDQFVSKIYRRRAWLINIQIISNIISSRMHFRKLYFWNNWIYSRSKKNLFSNLFFLLKKVTLIIYAFGILFSVAFKSVELFMFGRFLTGIRKILNK